MSLVFASVNTVPTTDITSAMNINVPANRITGLPPDGNTKMRIVYERKPKIARYSSKTLRSLQNGMSVNGDQVAFDEAAAAAATVQIIGGRKLNDFSDEYQLSRNVREESTSSSLLSYEKEQT
ncbi:hypothetical protein CYMTET_22121 [Cymbomonas tetramitiformis]|uniref:Uncharacterized protein n=1 Tax=Cymbomonas tetramitiformis TaxID=36881 RepID=A0AAE0G0V9_9CHLO|nr:hypothetical protein CYMTET_22121 [Cymbomonas tetramitiformis]